MSERKGQIHDLGYKRYVGTRLAQSTRWRVIMREQIASGWKKWWRYKLSLGGAVISMCIAGGLLFFLTNETVRSVSSLAGGGNDIALTFADAVVPLSIPWFCRMAFILSLTLGATIIATDNQSGAFTFYYVRSVRPWDYVLGKLAGYGTLVATLILAGPFLLACFRIGMVSESDASKIVDYLPILPKALLIGVLATAAYTALPLAISALVPNRRYALAMWAAYYLIVGNIAMAIGKETDSPLAALDVQTALEAITFDLFDLQKRWGSSGDFGATTGVIALLLQVGFAVGVIWFQVSRDQRHGVGGAG